MALYSPKPKNILAELIYRVEGKNWTAVVSHADEEKEGWQLWYRFGSDSTWQKSGTFTDGKELVRFLRSEAHKRFAGLRPIKDTLKQIESTSPWSVIPICYKLATPENKKDCNLCPYFVDCLSEVEKTEIKKIFPKETENQFRERLKEKIKKQWG